MSSWFKIENGEKKGVDILSLFVDLFNKEIASKGVLNIALSGGSTPAKLYKEIVCAKLNIDFNKINFFFSDERVVALNDPQSNYNLANSLLFTLLNISSKNIFPVDIEKEDFAADYEKKIVDILGENPKFDLILLGLGTDGHTASLFPNKDEDKNRLVIEVQKDGDPYKRISFTSTLINQGSNRVFIVTGKEKKDIFNTITKDSLAKESDFPAKRVISPIWIVDKELSEEIC